MSHIHVCLVSDQPIPNLTTALQFSPDRVVLLTTKEMQGKAGWLEEVLKKKGISVTREDIPAYNLQGVISVCERVIELCKDCDVSLNITGGTKIGTIGAFQSFYTVGKPIYYVDTQNDRIMEISPNERSYPIEVNISMSDYLATYGLDVKSYVKDDAYIFRRKQITDYLKEIAISKDYLIGKLNWMLRDFEKKSYPLTLEPGNEKGLVKLFKDIMQKDKSMIDVTDRDVKIPTREIAQYLAGGWFEEYVYMVAKSIAPSVALNVKGEWVTTGHATPKNEFDVILSQKNRLFLISCKTSYPDRIDDDSEESIAKEYLYELLALGDMAAGLFGKKMLASARPVRNEYVRKRAEFMKIKLVDGKNIATLKEVMRQWIGV